MYNRALIPTTLDSITNVTFSACPSIHHNQITCVYKINLSVRYDIKKACITKTLKEFDNLEEAIDAWETIKANKHVYCIKYKDGEMVEEPQKMEAYACVSYAIEKKEVKSVMAIFTINDNHITTINVYSN